MSKLVAINLIKSNPRNPRLIRDYKYKILLESLRTSFWMMEARPIVVDENMVVLGGNQRLKACQELKLKEVWVDDGSKWTKEQQAEFIIKDNTNFGEWDYDMLANEWDEDKLKTWGMEGFPFDASEMHDDKEYALENEAWFLNIEFEKESDAQKWYKNLKKENLNIKIVQ